MPRRTRPTTVFPAAIRKLRVLRVHDATPGMRRVTLGGDQLGAFTNAADAQIPEFVSIGFDDDVRLFFSYPGETEPVLPTVRPGGVSFPKDPRPLSRAYTVRRYDPVAGELDIDFVRHGVGVATTWADRTSPGDSVHVGGPSCSLGIPIDYDWFMVAGDETALPAIGRLLDELPADARAQVFIEVADEVHRQDLRELPGIEVTWLTRERSGTPTLLDAVVAAEWWSGRAFAWVAGEQAVVRELRRHFVEVRELPKGDIEFVGYWRREEVVARVDDPAIPDTDRNEKAYERFHEQSELLPPLAIRVAVTLGIGDHISRGVTTVPQLAERTGADARALGKLLRYLHAIDLLVPDAGGYRLSATGEFLASEYVIDELRSDGIAARIHRAWEGLEHSIRTGDAAYAAVTGQAFSTLRADPAFEYAFLEDISQYAGFVAEPLGKANALAGKGHVVVHAHGGRCDRRCAHRCRPGHEGRYRRATNGGRLAPGRFAHDHPGCCAS